MRHIVVKSGIFPRHGGKREGSLGDGRRMMNTFLRNFGTAAKRCSASSLACRMWRERSDVAMPDRSTGAQVSEAEPTVLGLVA